jgi:hypothetical protein
VANSGTGIVTITPTDSSITTYTDSEINFLDSNITFAGVDSITFYPTSGNANTGTSAGATITTSPYNFKYGSVISGVTMSGTLNIRYSIGGKVTIGTLTISLGSNFFVLTDNELLGSINASVALTAKEATLLQTEADIMTAIGSGGGGGGGGATAQQVWEYATRTLTAGVPTAAQNASAVRTELATELARVDVATSTRLAASAYTAPPTVAAIRTDIERTGGMLDTKASQTSVNALPAPLNSTQTQAAAAAALVAYDAVVPADLAGLATAANVTASQTAIVAEVNQNEVKIDAIKVDTAAIKAKTDALTNAPTVAQIRAEMETVGGKLDTTLKTAKKVRIQTL